MVSVNVDVRPLVGLIVRLCKCRGMPVFILCDTAHRIEQQGAETLVFNKGTDCVKFAPRQPGTSGRYPGAPGLQSGRHMPVPRDPGAESEWAGIHRRQHRRPA